MYETLYCEICGYHWKSRTEKPKVCARCKKRNWNIKKGIVMTMDSRGRDYLHSQAFTKTKVFTDPIVVDNGLGMCDHLKNIMFKMKVMGIKVVGKGSLLLCKRCKKAGMYEELIVDG